MNNIYQTLSGWSLCSLCNTKLYFKKFMGTKYVQQQEWFTWLGEYYVMTCKKCHDDRTNNVNE